MTEQNKSTTLLILALGLPTIINWLILNLRIPVFQALPFWFFQLRETPVQFLWILFAFTALGAAIFVTFSKTATPIKIFLLILFGTMTQFGFAFSKGQGLDALRQRMTGVGHAEFAAIAVEQSSMIDVARNYDNFLKDDAIPSAYTRSKPPGTLLFYMFTERLANLGISNAAPEQRLENLGTFASLTWPLISYIVLIPLFLFARELFDEQTALLACLLYLCIPAVNLVTLHTDQTIYPFMAAVPIWLACLASKKGNLIYAFLSGVTYYLAIYFSFGLAMIALLIGLPFLAELINSQFKNWKPFLRGAGMIALGVLISDILARLLLWYNIVLRYSDAIKHHIKWKEWEGGIGNLLRAGFTASTEFFEYLGIPLAILLFVVVGFAIHDVLINRKTHAASLYPLALAGTFGLLLLFGKTKSETARLWIFMIPFICLAAARFIQERAWTVKGRLWFVFYVMLLEFGTTYFLLRHQDFQ